MRVWERFCSHTRIFLLEAVNFRSNALSCFEASVAMQKQADAFRGHCFNLLVTAKTCAPAITRRKDTGYSPASFLRGFQLALFPLESLEHLLWGGHQ